MTKFKDKNSGMKDDGTLASVNELRYFISGEMIRVGFAPSLRGFRYFKELIVLSVTGKSSDKLMSRYGQVAEIFGVKTDALERNIRTLISSSFYNGDGFARLYAFFGLPCDNNVPTSGQLLALMTEYIMYKLFEKNIDGTDFDCD